MRATKALLLSNMLSSTESIENVNIATFDAPCVCTPDISVDLEPIQDLHGYDSPWPAGGGKNLLNPDTFSSRDSFYTINSNGTITVTADDTTGWSNIPVMPLKAGTYEFSRKIVGGKCFIRTSDDNYATNKMQITSTTYGSFTLAQDGGIKLRLDAEADSYPIMQEYQIEIGSSATAWSPYSNICPISGRSEVSVMRTGKNLLEEDAIASSGSQNGIDYVVSADGSITVSGTATANLTLQVMSKRDLPEGTYTVSGVPANSGGAGLRLWARDNNRYFSSVNGANDKGVLSMQVYSYITIANGTALSSPVTIYPQIELGSTASSYEPYQGQTVTILLGQTVYGGTVDVTNGVLTVTRANIASYAGETLPGTWICDRAVYAEGVTPPTGSQVVYELGTPIEVTLTPAQIQTLVGENNVWSDSGNISVRNITCDADFLKTYLLMKGVNL